MQRALDVSLAPLRGRAHVEEDGASGRGTLLFLALDDAPAAGGGRGRGRGRVEGGAGAGGGREGGEACTVRERVCLCFVGVVVGRVRLCARSPNQSPATSTYTRHAPHSAFLTPNPTTNAPDRSFIPTNAARLSGSLADEYGGA